MTFGTDLVSSGHSVLVLKNDLAGDFANVLALGDALARRMRCDVDLIEAKLRVNLLLPGIWTILALRSRAAAAPDPGQGWRVWRLMFSGRAPGKDRYAAVVSTLGSGEAPAAFVASFWGAPALHLGAPKRLPRRHFSAIVAHPGQAPRPGDIVLPIAPTLASTQGRGSGPADGQPIFGALIGGNTREIVYSDAFPRNFVRMAAHEALRRGAKLNISTSPRSGLAVEALVERAADEQAFLLNRMIPYGRGRGGFLDLLGQCHVVFVTAESVSMISDALASGARVVAVYERNLPRSGRIWEFLSVQSASGRLKLLDLTSWRPDDDLRLDEIEPLEDSWSDALWEQLGPAFRANDPSPVPDR